MIKKLAAEYKDELAALDVRLKKLETKADKLQIYGNARIRYNSQSKGSTYRAIANEPSGTVLSNTYDDQHINLDVHFLYAVSAGWAVKAESEWQRQINLPQEMNTAGLKAQAERN